MAEPEVWSLEHLLASDLGRAMVWTHESLRERVRERFSQPILGRDSTPPSGLDSLVVVGGGELMDRAKAWRAQNSPSTRLFAIPSLWASGAEASPIIVLNSEHGKSFRKGSEYLPDIRVVWEDLAQTVSPELARWACGDVWAHALEGFLSPLGDPTSRSEAGALLARLLDLPLSSDPRWFEMGALACAAQARTGVGLVHGIAHVLEPVLRQEHPGLQAGHARLCATYLWPVFRLNRTRSEKPDVFLRECSLDPEAIEAALMPLFEADFYRETLPALKENWHRILRDPCTRINCVLVRSDHLSHFLGGLEG